MSKRITAARIATTVTLGENASLPDETGVIPLTPASSEQIHRFVSDVDSTVKPDPFAPYQQTIAELEAQLANLKHACAVQQQQAANDLQAVQAGFLEKARLAAVAELRTESQQQQQAMQNLLSQLQQNIQQTFEHAQAYHRDILTSCLNKLVAEHWQDDAFRKALVTNTVAHFAGYQRVKIELSAADYPLFSIADDKPSAAQFEVNTALQQGDCRVVLESGMQDASLAQYLKTLQQVIDAIGGN